MPREKLPWQTQAKRLVIGLLGVALVPFSAFASYKVLTERPAEDYWMLILTIGLLIIGMAMIRVALRGKRKEIQDVLW